MHRIEQVAREGGHHLQLPRPGNSGALEQRGSQPKPHDVAVSASAPKRPPVSNPPPAPRITITPVPTSPSPTAAPETADALRLTTPPHSGNARSDGRSVLMICPPDRARPNVEHSASRMSANCPALKGRPRLQSRYDPHLPPDSSASKPTTYPPADRLPSDVAIGRLIRVRSHAIVEAQGMN